VRQRKTDKKAIQHAPPPRTWDRHAPGWPCSNEFIAGGMAAGQENDAATIYAHDPNSWDRDTVNSYCRSHTTEIRASLAERAYNHN